MSSAAQVKDGGRSDRLAWSKRAEQRLRDELKEIALKKCDAEVATFVACAKAKGLMVAFSCRTENRGMNECLHQFTNEAAFEKYKVMRGEELAAGSLGGSQ
eukprot:TRINITY_DN2753_c0_g1_i1.p1 TRINITY_DN2753_c0_g1~~TRINITY_DN2753_c0_g1_i1.p1  ORF type:complete len:101 (-),score=18.41 TRINITY_DN2753_c0_g1_i1:64-366(-)